MKLDIPDPRHDRAAWAARLGISREAIDVYAESEVIDLHVDSYIWTRIFGYDLTRRHGLGLFGGRFYSQVDFPRVLEAGLTGATWVITTNPLRPRGGRTAAFHRNLAGLTAEFARVPEQFVMVRTTAEFRAARAAGKHGAFVGIQGANAVDSTHADVETLDDRVVRATLVHLSSSTLGTTSSPLKLGGDPGLTTAGKDYVRALEGKRIFPDLAHVSRRGFADAVAVHDRSLPLLVTHTGVDAVRRHWRNLTDEQVRAVADSGGTVGIMLQSSFLARGLPLDPGLGRCPAEAVVLHAEHVRDLVGDDHVSLGTDYDGAITPPTGLESIERLPLLAQLMLDRGWRPESIRKFLGENFLRTVAAMRG